MATEVHAFQVSIPAGTPANAPAIFNLTMPPRVVLEIRVRIPPGPRGEVGFAVGAAGVAILPQEVGSFVVADGETIRWPLANQITSGAWQIQAYNTGQFTHTLYVQMLTDLTSQPAPTNSQPDPIDALALSGG